MARTFSGCEDRSQSVNGTMMAAGWKNEVWNVDIGRTPDNFKVPNWLGGVAYSSKIGSLGWTLTGSRRPLSNSILSYAGATDLNTGVTWGGVTSNGVTLSLSHDEGGVDGVWASFGQHWLRGKNVEDNHKSTAMAGYYYRLVERADERLRTGLTLMYWGMTRTQVNTPWARVVTTARRSTTRLVYRSTTPSAPLTGQWHWKARSAGRMRKPMPTTSTRWTG